MEKYNITQHQTSIDIDLSKLSKEQIVPRIKEVTFSVKFCFNKF